ncbi:unknown [Spodoptera litura nucleopolyhedrovirus]|uniref:Ac108 n=1 Tax=Spodoptera litura multicapsid nucleopolyhedrovirus TaxID=46242 RepID=Q91BD0_NPVST|nr:hypothetical protein [Spodoptera litura nucleopolyhedrovirus]WML75161.1 hypothetical protein KBIHDJOI_00119 [Spodoptera littoralis nucleopolyhedrovirus]AAL01779.1 unknown [Spodoptera litura nucleopolyhedrovirus]QHN73946.1 hypothetical protein [Spodoptera litura nucleopolyhedrovirus]UQV25632.1 hypothetical protein [Spodoptera litura nucleopolyhedrovirus]WOC30955.1 hypothetical protein GACBDANE_00038 [Spodoptera litura nucleopolyhedrovirus]
MNTLNEDVTRQPSVLDYDQLGQIVSRNRIFLRDFVLVICGLIVFIVIIVFMLLVYNINETVRLEEYERESTRQRYLANYDFTRRTVPATETSAERAARLLETPSRPSRRLNT